MRTGVHGALWLAVGVIELGCGRLGFDPSSTTTDGAPTDAVPTDGVPADAATLQDPWDGSFTMEFPELVANVNSAGVERDCSFSRDGLTMYFSSNRTGSVGSWDFYSATRPSLGAPFEVPQHLTDLSSAAQDGMLFEVDDVSALVSSSRGGGGVKLSMITRGTSAAPWTWTSAVELTEVNSPDGDHDPWMSSDRLRLYFNSDRGGQNDVYTATRATPGAAFGAPTVMTELSSPELDANATLSADELFLVFFSSRPGGAGSYDIYFARRVSVTEPFGPPQLMPVVNTASLEWEPCLSPDGYLYFSSDRAGGVGMSNIYRARFVPE